MNTWKWGENILFSWATLIEGLPRAMLQKKNDELEARCSQSLQKDLCLTKEWSKDSFYYWWALLVHGKRELIYISLFYILLSKDTPTGREQLWLQLILGYYKDRLGDFHRYRVANIFLKTYLKSHIFFVLKPQQGGFSPSWNWRKKGYYLIRMHLGAVIEFSKESICAFLLMMFLCDFSIFKAYV